MRSHRSELAMGRRARWSALAAQRSAASWCAPGLGALRDLPTVKSRRLRQLPLLSSDHARRGAARNYKKAGVQVELRDFKGRLPGADSVVLAAARAWVSVLYTRWSLQAQGAKCLDRAGGRSLPGLF